MLRAPRVTTCRTRRALSVGKLLSDRRDVSASRVFVAGVVGLDQHLPSYRLLIGIDDTRFLPRVVAIDHHGDLGANFAWADDRLKQILDLLT